MLAFSGSNSYLYKTLFIISIVVLLLPIPADSLWLRELFNSGHILVFVFITLYLYRYLSLRYENDNRVATYLIVLAVAFTIGVIIEVLQSLMQREVSISDLIRNLFGIIVALSLTTYIQKKVLHIRLLLAAIIFLCLSFGFYSLLELSWHYQQRSKAFPNLTEFEEKWTTSFVRYNKASLRGIAGKKSRPGTTRFKFLFERGIYPGISIIEPIADWSGYRSLHFDVFSTNIDGVMIVLRVHDRQHNHEYRDRYNQSFIIRPGLNRIVVDLADIRDAPFNRKIDMVNIASVQVFVPEVDEPLFLEVSNIFIKM